jgi:Predicted transcriptional regulators
MSTNLKALRIGELAKATGVSVRALRHYDGHGLLASTRAGNGYRLFQPQAIDQVRQLQRLLGAGFSLEEIKTFPDCMRLIEGAKACPQTSALHRKRLAMLEKQITELERRRARLRAMLTDAQD